MRPTHERDLLSELAPSPHPDVSLGATFGRDEAGGLYRQAIELALKHVIRAGRPLVRAPRRFPHGHDLASVQRIRGSSSRCSSAYTSWDVPLRAQRRLDRLRDVVSKPELAFRWATEPRRASYGFVGRAALSLAKCRLRISTISALRPER